MGFMGFGMRKEVYKRKPKKSFERIKEYQKLVSNTDNPPLINASKEYQKFRFKSLRERKWMKLIFLLFFSTILAYVIFESIILPDRLAKAKAEFLTSGAINFYEQDGLDDVEQFFYTRKGKLDEIRTSYSSGIIISIRSEDYVVDKFFGKIYSPIKNKEKVTINNGVLSIEFEDEVNLQETNWRTEITVNNIAEVDSSVLNYLQADAVELDSILRKIITLKLDVLNEDKGTVISFNKSFGKFSIHYYSEIDTSFVYIRQIKPKVYLCERRY